MSDSIDVRMAREVDREALREVLAANGVEAEPLEEGAGLGFRIPCGDSAEEREELIARLELLVADTGLPLVPQPGDGFVFLRPPAD
jgi:predicted RNA-binding protein with PUA domain